MHTDLVGPTKTKELKGEKYFMLLVDDYTRMIAVFFLKNKSEAFENFKIYKEMVENEMDSRIKCLRYDNGGEFTSKEIMDYCSSHGIKRQFFVARTPQENGVVERKNMTVQEMVRTILMDSKLTDIFWTQEMHTIVHIQNRVILKNNIDKLPMSYGKEDRKCEALQSFWKQMLHQKRRWQNGKVRLSCGQRNTCWLLKYKESIRVLQSKIEQSCGKNQRNN
jgi:transposase InsO family protein